MFTRQPGSSLYTLNTVPPPVAESGQVASSGQVFAAASWSGPESAPCLCHLLSHQTLLWYHLLGHPSLPRLRGMASRVLVTGLPRLQLRVRGQGHERYFLLVVDDYSRYTPVFPLRRKGEVTDMLIDWIRAARRQLSESFGSDLPVLRLHSDRGGEFSSDLQRAFCRAEGIRQTFTLLATPHQNGIAERHIGMVMDVARASMIHAAAPHFLWPFAVLYAAHQINLQPRVSLPETTPTLRWTGKVGDASAFRVWGSRAFVRDLSADKLSSRAVPCVFLGFPLDALGWQFYHPTSRRVLSSQDVTLDESGRAPSGVSQVDAVEPVEVAVDSGAARGVEPEGAGSGGAEPERAEPRGAKSGDCRPVVPFLPSCVFLYRPREPESRLASPVCAACTSRRGSRQRPPPVPGTHQMALRPSTAPQHVPLPSPSASSLPSLADLPSDLARAASPTVTRLLTTGVTDPSFESTAASALVAELVGFAAHCRLDYAASLVAESESVCPPSVGGECALSTDVLEDRQEGFQCFATALPHLRSMHVLQRFNFTYSSPQATPLSTRHSLSALSLDESVVPSGPYPELIGCLMYLMTCTRPHSAYPLSILARYVAPWRHRPEHMDAANRVLHYLCSTSGMGLVLGGRARVVLTGHADASWELRWLTYLLTDLGEAPRSPPVLYIDNKAMLALCQKHRLEHRTKHIALRYFLAQELQQRGQLRLAYVATRANTADIFTKALQPSLPRPSRRPAPPSRPAAAAAASARATAVAGGGAAGSTGGAAGARGAGPTTNCHCLSWPLSRQL
ncbi:unnamed protein product [Closterium sp. NIES-54]